MTARTLARLSSSAGVVVCASSVAACGLLYGFEHYDTDVVPAARDAADAEEAGAVGDFELMAADNLRIEPGASAPLVVQLRRTGGSAERVVVLLADPLPPGLGRAPPATLEPDASSATLTLTALASAVATTQTLHVTATSASRTRTKDVSLTLRGLPCSAERRFGNDPPGTATFGKGPPVGLGLLASPSGPITMALGGPFTTLYRLDAAGRAAWDQAATLDTPGIVVDATLGVELVTQGKVVRYRSDSSIDFGYGGIIPTSCTPGAVTSGGSGMTIVCSDATATFGLLRFDASGAGSFGDVVPFGFGIAATAVSSSASAVALVACGHAADSTKKYGAFARWLPSGKRDEAFGTAGGVRLDSVAMGDSGGIVREPIACLTDAAGVVGLLAGKSDRVLLALTPAGAVDTTFGNGGVIPLQSAASTPVTTAALALDAGAVLVAASTSAGTFVVRYLRSGRLDTTFGEGGYCPLGPAAAEESVSAVALTADHTLLILTTGAGQARLSSIWL